MGKEWSWYSGWGTGGCQSGEENKRIDSFIPTKDEKISRTAAQRMIEEGQIKVNNKNTKVSDKVMVGDEIQIEEVAPKEIELKAQNIPIDIIYEDKDIIVGDSGYISLCEACLRKRRKEVKDGK